MCYRQSDSPASFTPTSHTLMRPSLRGAQLKSITSWTCGESPHTSPVKFLQRILTADRAMKGMLIAASDESGTGDSLFLRTGYSGWDAWLPRIEVEPIYCRSLKYPASCVSNTIPRLIKMLPKKKQRKLIFVCVSLFLVFSFSGSFLLT